jgi:tRNA(Ile)-lysidine synthase
LTVQFTHVLEAALTRVFPRADGVLRRMAVAFSGGLDSTVLLHLAHDYARQRCLELFAFHVHHGLQPAAEEWLQHCEAYCAHLGVPCVATRLQLNSADQDGVEGAARRERYRALAHLCRQKEVGVLLTAHHEDDQVETVLLQLLRGAGLAGLSGMAVQGDTPCVEAASALPLVRPLLFASRGMLKQWAEQHHLRYVTDASNSDTRHARSALRTTILPHLSARFPGFEKGVTRFARHAATAQYLLNTLAIADYQACSLDGALDVQQIADLDVRRADNLLRYWLSCHGVRMPSERYLEEIRSQLLQSGASAQPELFLESRIIRRFRNRLYCLHEEDVPRDKPRADDVLFPFVWAGEERIRLEAFGGVLSFFPSAKGVSTHWLRGRPLQLGHYRGSLRFRVAANRPAKRLKQLCQEREITVWARRRLPLLYEGDRLVFVGGIGLSAEYADTGSDCLEISWLPDAALPAFPDFGGQAC